MMNNKILRPWFGIPALVALIVFTAIAPIGAVVPLGPVAPHGAVVPLGAVAPHAGLGQADAKKVTVTLMRWPYT